MKKATKVCEEAAAGRHESATLHTIASISSMQIPMNFATNMIQVTRTEEFSGYCRQASTMRHYLK